jgi:hypothetical protein
MITCTYLHKPAYFIKDESQRRKPTERTPRQPDAGQQDGGPHG